MTSTEITRTVLITLCFSFLTVPTVNALTANEWKKLEPAEQQAYICGVVDTWRNFATLENYAKGQGDSPPDATAQIFAEVAHCTAGKGITYKQIIAVVRKYLKNNPSEWHIDMASLIFEAVHAAFCEPQPTKTTH